MTAVRHIGILGGSFNPVHIGHIMLADYIAQYTSLDEVWLMLSPLNPLKEHPEDLIPDAMRLEMLRLAVNDNPRLKVCDVELSMPRPSYTIDSLQRLESMHPNCIFSLLIGSDNWLLFDRWREYRRIIEHYTPIIYPRPGYPVDSSTLPQGVTLVNAPTVDLSSTFLRKAIADRYDMTNFLPHGVARYIADHHLYGKYNQ